MVMNSKPDLRGIAQIAIATAAFAIMLAAPCQAQGQTAYPRWVAASEMNVARAGHSATLLANGQVLVVGGDGAANTAEVYDYTTNTWRLAGSLNVIRSVSVVTKLADGGALAIGWAEDNGPCAEVYDPGTRAWKLAATPIRSRSSPTATLLRSGKVLVAGGLWRDLEGALETELYDPVADTWIRGGRLVSARDGARATTLQDGRVLITGGTIYWGSDASPKSGDVFDPDTGTWTVAAGMQVGRAFSTATLLPNGRVLVAESATSAELFDPASGQWLLTAGMNAPRSDHTASLLPDGRVLVVGGVQWPGVGNGKPRELDGVEIYDPASSRWEWTAMPAVARNFHTATVLPNGKVLVAGGAVGMFDGPPHFRTYASAELFESSTPPADTSFRITALFSDQAGLYQAVALTEASGLGTQRLAGLSLVSVSRSGVVKRHTFSRDLPSVDTAHRNVLVKSISLDLPEGHFDYAIPDGFVPTEAGGFVAIEHPDVPGAWLAVAHVDGLPADGHTVLRGTALEPNGELRSFAGPPVRVVASVDPVIEFYNAALDHYFMTASQPDLDALDSGRVPGWRRTGHSFPAWISTFVDPRAVEGARPPPGLLPVCRIYIPPARGDSHFFSVSGAECDRTLQQFPHLVMESRAAFLAVLPDAVSGKCPAGQSGVYRLWNARADSNHRYTRSLAVRNEMTARGYIAEGYGPDGVALCVGGAL